MRSVLSALAAAAMMVPSASFAHVGLESPQALAGSYHKITLKVAHGCDGNPTSRIRVQIPEGVVGVKTMLKPQWKTEVVRGRYAAPVDDGHGRKITEGVKE